MAGQLVQRGDRTWLVRVYMGRHPETNKRRYHNKTIHGNKKAAQRYLNRVLREKDTGEFTEPSRQSLNGYLDRWLEMSAKPRLRPSTLEDYKDRLRLYVRPALGDRALADLSPVEIQALYSKMQAPKPDGMGLSPRSIRYAHTILHSALQQAVKWQLLPRNPAKAVDLPRLRQTEMRCLSRDEAARFLEVAGSFPGDPRVIEQNGRDPRAGQPDRWYALWVLLITTGLRPGEALGLKWNDLDGDRLRIRRTLTRRYTPGWRLEEPKTARGRRTVTLPDTTARALHAHRAKQAEEKLSTGPDYEDNGLIFASEVGEPCHQGNIRRRSFQKILKAAKLPTIRMYDLRHTAATLLLSAGIHPKIVSERLGHASITLTLDTYSHVLPDMQEEAAEKIEVALF